MLPDLILWYQLMRGDFSGFEESKQRSDLLWQRGLESDRAFAEWKAAAPLRAKRREEQERELARLKQELHELQQQQAEKRKK